VGRLLSPFGIVVQSHRRFDHEDDVTYELRLSGPAKQFDYAAFELGSNPIVQSVQFE
jgi:hypothetical protein